MNSLLYLVFLHTIGFSQKALSRLFEKKTHYQEFYENIDQLTLEQLWYKADKISAILTAKEKLDIAKITHVIEALQVKIVTIWDVEYPELLRQVPISPYFLYIRGTPPSHTNLLSVVGSRKSTPYSRATLSEILPEIIQKWYGIVSWGAYGVDSLGHKITIEHGGYTLAVFWTGIDRCYPQENKDLFNEILKSGWALISAFPIGMWPEPYNFPIRNEIVAGISRWTLVTEAAEKSGTLITAGLALDFGRDVFAFPGDITKKTSIGTNVLIRDGQAKLVIQAIDILSEYETMTVIDNNISLVIPKKFDDPIEQALYELLWEGSRTISSIEDVLDIDVATIAFKLSMMEVCGVIKMEMDGSYSIR